MTPFGAVCLGQRQGARGTPKRTSSPPSGQGLGPWRSRLNPAPSVALHPAGAGAKGEAPPAPDPCFLGPGIRNASPLGNWRPCCKPAALIEAGRQCLVFFWTASPRRTFRQARTSGRHHLIAGIDYRVRAAISVVSTL